MLQQIETGWFKLWQCRAGGPHDGGALVNDLGHGGLEAVLLET